MTDPKTYRKELHQIPELAFGEFRTKAYILSQIKRHPDLKIIEFSQSPGLLVEYAKLDTPFRLFRADMDALPMQEQTNCSYSSTHDGIMHACGHDVHMAVLLGLIDRVVEMQPKVNLLFIFQPAEEGKGGAECILSEGIIQNYDIEAVFALHVHPKLPIGTVSSRPGIFFAIPQEFDVTFFGKKAHAAIPEDGRDALRAGMEFYTQMSSFAQSLEERNIFHIGVMNSGVIRNVIPDKCILEGTHRTLSLAAKQQMNDQIHHNAHELSIKYKVDYKIDFLCSYEPVVNNPSLVDELKDVCSRLSFQYQESPIYMTGEDFGFFTSLYPGLLFWLGANDPAHDLHSETFLPDEDCIEAGIETLYNLIRR